MADANDRRGAPKSGVAGDRRTFLRSWVRDPWRVAAIAPSGLALARLITSEIAPEHAPVVELGPGTGVFTRALIERGIPERRLALVEGHPTFAQILQFRFPQARVLSMDAALLGEVEPFAGEGVGAVISGLPMLSMPLLTMTAILRGAFQRMRPDAAFYQFTYGPRCPVPRRVLDELGLHAARLGWTVANLPPASVYRIRRRGASASAGGG